MVLEEKVYYQILISTKKFEIFVSRGVLIISVLGWGKMSPITPQGWIQRWKTDGVIIDVSVQRACCVAGSASEVARSVSEVAAEIFWSLLSVQTTRRSNLALAGRRLNRIFMDSYNKFSRLTLKKWENKN